jgi:sensor histidine kinase YesM
MFDLRYSLSIGFSILLFSHLFMVWRGICNLDGITSGIAIILGTCLGIVLGTLANGINPLLLLQKHPNLLQILLLVSIVCGPAISYFFYSRGVLAEATAALRQEEIERISYEQRLAEANLRVLQAQIEPHFLFNTLSNVLSLIPTKPDMAEKMLSDFTCYLRASLQQTRLDRIRLAEELATVRSYLDIMAVRMVSRLQYHFEVVPELLDIMVPPLLIQPLVENAVEHGIDPKTEGGSITITVKKSGDMLLLEISDTGDGISLSSSMGVGMGNIRDRLQLLYGGEASFQVLPNTPHGTTIRLAIPIDTGENHDQLN